MRRTCVTLLAALAVLAPATVLAPGAGAAPSSSTGLPADSAAQGYIGLCDEAGHNVTGGSIDAAPFVWKAVASAPPPAQFRGTGENAVLEAFQPRPDVQPGEWSGTALTSASFFSTPNHPAVQATYADQSLASLVTQFPPRVNGLYVLRMYFGKAGYGLYNRTYPTTTIQVVGKHWSVVSGGTVDCSAATGVSNEQLTGVVTRRETTPRRPAASSAATTTSGATTGPITQAPQRLTSDSGTSSGPSAGDRVVAATASDDGASVLPWVVALVAVLFAVAAGVVLRLRTRAR